MPKIISLYPLIVCYSMWRKPHFYVNKRDGSGESIVFSRLQEARDFAKQHNYNGIKIEGRGRK